MPCLFMGYGHTEASGGGRRGLEQGLRERVPRWTDVTPRSGIASGCGVAAIVGSVVAGA